MMEHAALPPPTAAELKELFAVRGVRPSRTRGQNFLVDPAQMRFVADAAELTGRDVVLEPGPGTGGLTGLLSQHAGAVVAVELDRKLFDLASERLAGLANVTLIHSDIMGKGDRIAPAACEAISKACARIPQARLKVVANLPYAVSTSFIAAMLAPPVRDFLTTETKKESSDALPLCSHSQFPSSVSPCLRGETLPSEVVVMVQKEVADRLCAAPGSEAYGYLSVIVQALARVEILRKLSPKSFWPQPEVDSAVVRIHPDDDLRQSVGDGDRLRAVAGGLFTHRRKQLAAAMRQSGLTTGLDQARALLDSLGLNPQARCEQLPVADFIRIAKALP